MFRTDLLSIIRSLNPLNAELNPFYQLLALLGAHNIFHISRIRVNTVLTITGICDTSYVDCLLVRSGWNITSVTNTDCCEYSTKTPDDGQ